MGETDTDPLRAFGWDDGWEAAWREAEPEPADGVEPGRVVRVDRELSRVVARSGEVSARLPGNLRRDPSARPAVGDWVSVEPLPGDGDEVLVRSVLPRRGRFARKAAGEATAEQVVAANVDVVFLVTGLDGDFSPRRIERYLTLAWDSGARPVVVLNKADLADDPEALADTAREAAPGVPVLVLSAATGERLAALEEHLEPGGTAALLGSSGVGKSTLVNRLLGEERMATGEVRATDDRGRHTTTHRELLQLPGGALLIDTPGMRELQVWGDEEAVEETFPEIEELAAACRFRDCSHEGDPGCAVEAAVEDGTLDPGRLESYRKLQREFEALARRKEEHERRAHDRRTHVHYRKVQRAARKRKGR